MDIGQIQNPFAQTQSPAAQGPAQGAAVNFGGYEIRVTNAASLVADSAEEASFAMSEREEVRLSERKMKPKGPDTRRLEQVEKYTEIMDKQGRQDDLDKLVAALSSKKGLSPGDAVRQAFLLFKDPTDAYAALAYAGKKLGESLDSGTFAEALDQLDDLAGREIKHKLVAGVAAQAFESLGSAGELKDLYAYTVLDSGSPREIFERLVKDYGMERFEEAVNFLARTLGNDMAATTSSTDKVQLAGIARDLGVVRQLHGLNAQCKTLHDRMLKSFGGKYALSPADLAQEVLKLRDARFIGAFDIEAIADKAAIKAIEDRIVFFQDFGNTARDLSETLFADDNGRLSLIQAIQDALDDAISVEDQMYEEPGQKIEIRNRNQE